MRILRILLPLMFLAMGGTASFCQSSSEIQIDWSTVAPYRILKTGDYAIRVTGVNDLVYQYELSVVLNDSASSDIALLIGIFPELTKLLSTPTQGRSIAPQCDLPDLLEKAIPLANSLNSRLADMVPGKGADGKYLSVPLRDSLAKWNLVLEAYDAYGRRVEEIRLEKAKPNCRLAQEDQRKAQKVLDDFEILRLKMEATDRKAKGNHSVIGHAYIDRSRNGSVIVRQLFNGSETSGSPKTFPLEAGFSVVTASGGFLLTTLQARSYSAQAVPPVPPATTNSTVLAVSGVSGVRPALVALLNYHDPFNWGLNGRDFGLAISAGPVIEVANGNADRSRFGFFGGVSMHFWHRLFVTPGVHVGEFPDFPQGFTNPGQIVPPNFGTLTPIKRYTAKFGVSITFRGGDPSTLLGNSSKPPANGAPASPSGVKQP